MMGDGCENVSFGADGASVNMSTHGGVIAHLQSEAGSHIFPIFCMPHGFVITSHSHYVALLTMLLLSNV